MSKRDRELKQRLDELFSSPIEPEPAEPVPIEAEPIGPAAAPAAPAIDAMAALAGQIDSRLWKTILDHIPLPIYIKDRDHKWIVVNPAFAQLLGQPAGTLLGHVDKEQDDEAWRLDDQVLETGQPDDAQVSVVAPDGSIHTRRVRRVPLSDGGTPIPYVLGIIEDTLKSPAMDARPAHDRVELQAELAEQRQNVARFRAIVEATPIPVLITRAADGKALYVNSRAAELFGVTQHDILYRATPELYADPADRQKILALMQRDGRVTNCEARLKRADGSSIWVMLSSQPMTFNGEAAVLSGFYDITDRKRAEDALRDSEQQFRDLFENANALIQSVAMDGSFVYVNRTWLQTLGYTADEVARLHLFDIIHPDSRDHCLALFQRIANGEKIDRLEATFVAKDGRAIMVAGSTSCSFRDGQPIFTRGIFENVTAHRQAEDELRRLSRAVDQSPASIVITDLDGTIQYVNKKFTDITGYTFDEALGQNPRMLKSGQTPPETYQQMWATITRGGEWRGELLNKKKNGELFWEDATLSPVTDAQGRIIHFLAVKEDITERKRAEEELRRLSHAVDQSPASIFITDLKGTIQYVNQKFTEVTGYTPDEAIGQNPRLFKSGETPAETYQQMWSTLLNGGEWRGELLNKKKNGELFWEDTRLSPIVDAQGRLLNFLAVKEDVTERKRLQAENERTAQLLRILLENIPDLIYIKNARSEFIVANEPTARALGAASPDELIAKTDLDFYPRDMAAQFLAAEQAIMQSGQPLIAYEETATDPQGNPVWRSSTKVPYRGKEGQVEGLVGITVDITQRKRAELERERLLAIEARRALQLQTAAEISKAAASILRTEELMPFVVELIRERFDLYYVGLFLTDPVGQWAVLRAGTGEAGRRMLDGFHQLEVGGSSMIGRCVATGQARIALDVGEEAVRFDNPLLPKTRSEMALPLISRGQTLGALSIQSSKLAAFTPEDITVLQTMADQVANALANAQLFEQTHKQANEAAALNEIMQAITQHVDLTRALEATYDHIRRLIPLDFFMVGLYDEQTQTVHYPVIYDEEVRYEPVTGPMSEATFIGRVVQTGEPLHIRRTAEDLAAEAETTAESRIGNVNRPSASLLFMPLKIGPHVEGVLSAQSYELNAYTPEHINLLERITNLVAVAIQNARLFDQTQRDADRERLINQITAKMRNAQNVDQVLRIAVQELRAATKASWSAVEIAPGGGASPGNGRKQGA